MSDAKLTFKVDEFVKMQYQEARGGGVYPKQKRSASGLSGKKCLGTSDLC